MQHPFRLHASALQLVVAFSLCLVVVINAQADSSIDSSTGYSPGLAEQTALLSSVAYCEEESSIINWSCEPCQLDRDLSGCVIQGIAQKHSVLGYVAMCPDLNLVIAAFRGTDNLRNKIQDIEAFPVKYGVFPRSRVHLGFYRDWVAIRTHMTRLLNASIAKMPSNATVHVTGHSLGGALAVLAAAEWAAEPGIELATRPSTRIYTFGQPRVGNKAFSRAYTALYKGRHRRVVNAKDPVPHLPPKFLGYYHVGGEVWYPKAVLSPQNKYKVCANSETKSCSDSIFPFFYKLKYHLTYWNVHFGKCDATKLTR